MRLVLLAVLLQSQVVAAAEPVTVEACVEASATGQRAERAGALSEARAQYQRCASPECPGLVQSDCTKWLAGVLAATPSVVVVVRRGGVDVPDARVKLDGKPWLSHLSGQPADVDPGEHRLSVEADGLRLEQKVLFHAGEKGRLLVLQLEAGGVTASPAPVTASATAPSPWLLAGGAAVGVALFTGFGLAGRLRLQDLEASPCAATRTCNPESVSQVRTAFLVADVSLVLGALSAAGAGWAFWREGQRTPTVTPSVAAGPGSFVASVSGSF